MTDNKSKRGKRDRSKVARLQDYEVGHVAEKFGVSLSVVCGIIRKIGNERAKVYRALRRRAAA